MQIKLSVRGLTNERDKLSAMCAEANDELEETRSELHKCAKTAHVSLAVQSVLKRVEKERDAAMCELRSATAERDTFKERLRASVEQAVHDKACLESQLHDMQSMLRNADMDKKELCEQCDMLQAKCDKLAARIHEQSCALAQTEQHMHEHQASHAQMRLLAEDSERALDEQRRQLAARNDEVHALDQLRYKLEQKLMDMQELSRAHKDEIGSLRATCQSLDKEKDTLAAVCEERAAECAAYKHEMANKQRRVDELNAQLGQLDAALDRAQDEVAARVRETSTLRQQCERMADEGGEVARRYESTVRENKRLQEDLITVTRENQVLHAELDKCNADKDKLREQLQDYVNEVLKFEELLGQKEQDRGALLEQYRDVAQELNAIKLNLNAFESESYNQRMELQMKHGENKRLRDKLDAIERDFQAQLSACQEYECKLSGANRQLQRVEDALKKCQSEHDELFQDLVHTRELNSRLEQCKEELTRQMTSKELDYEQLHHELDDRRAESDLLKSQINSERTMIKNLEELIANSREKDFQMLLTTQEKESEVKLLKDRIVLSEQKM